VGVRSARASLLCAVIACAPAGASESPSSAPLPAPVRAEPRAEPAPTTAIAALERDAHARVNAYRRGRSLPALAWDEHLAAIARRHSEAMARGRRPFGHEGFTERAKAAAAIAPFASMAENVGRNTYRESEAARVAAEGWVGSSGHRHNIEGRFDRTGIGVARSASGAWYFTQLFVRAR
jgi:uncharacterized protein YkwD